MKMLVAGWSKRVVRVAVGLVVRMGLARHTSAEALATATERARSRDSDVAQEMNRVLRGLWRMEDVQHARGRGQFR